MKKPNLALPVAVAVVTTACGDRLSLHALFTPESQVFDSALDGQWEREDDRLLVLRAGDGYAVTVQDKRDRADSIRYEVHLVDLNGVRFADLRQEDTIGHMFVRVRVANGELHLAFLDAKWLRDRIPHEEADVEDGKTRSVLTVSTARLRELLDRFSSRLEAYDREIVYGHPQ